MVLTGPRQKLYTFMDGTTFHGLRYITDRTGRPIRRLLWFAVCGAFFCLFFVICAQQAEEYYKRRTTVSIEITYPPEMGFPAVTVCNMNMMRSSVAIHRGLYDSLKNAYTRIDPERSPANASCEETFLGYVNKTIEENPQAPRNKLVVDKITSEVCQQLCISNTRFHCNTILYDKNSMKCTAMEALIDSSEVTVTTKPGVDLLQRKRCESKPDIRCSFAANLCDFEQGQNDTANWLKAVTRKGITKYTGPDHDHTSGKGHYLYADLDDGLVATLVSPLIATAGHNRCVEFYYHMYGRDVRSLKLYLQYADRRRRLLWTKQGNQGKRWHRAFIRIPDDLFIILIEATGSIGKERYIAIDDLRIANCEIFEGDCKRHRDSSDYMGNTSVSESNKQCLPWAVMAKVGKLNEYLFPYSTFKDAQNYCRRPEIQEEYSNPAWCYVSKDGDRENCNIKYCECDAETEFTCDNKKCVSREMMCDGGNDCGDKSDENGKECNTSLQCDFENQFICGYTVQQDSEEYTWTFNRGNTSSYGTGPMVDFTKKSDAGGYMYVDSTLGLMGDKAILTSPINSTAMPFCLSFAYHMFGDHVGSLEVNLIMDSIDPLKIHSEVQTRKSMDEWQNTSITVNHERELLRILQDKGGKGGKKFNVKIGFKAVRGNGTRGDMAIDGVTIESGICSGQPVCEEFQCQNGACVPNDKKCNGIDDCQDNTDEGTHCANTSCTFDGESLCGYIVNKKSKSEPFKVLKHEAGYIEVMDGSRLKNYTSSHYVFWNASIPQQMQTLISHWQPVQRDSCASYIRRALGERSGILKVYIEYAQSQKRELVQSYVRDGIHGWIKEQFSIKASGDDVRLIFEASSIYVGSDVSIDNIAISNTPCDNSHVQISCSFDDVRVCGYTIGIKKDFTWRRVSSPGRGHVMEVDHAAIYGSNTTSLFSPKLQLSEAHCLQFDYKIYGVGPGPLSVLLYQDSYIRQLWKVSGDKEDKWHSMSLLVPTGKETMIVFQAVRGYEDSSHVALDNVLLGIGGCVSKQCLKDQFQCNNGMCLNQTLVCDGIDDCGDMTDETRCTDTECSISPNGEFYVGPNNKAENNQECDDWSVTVTEMPPPDFPGTPQQIFPDVTKETILNNCRNPGGLKDKPGCKVKGKWTSCSIKPCDCSEAQFQCNNKRCVSNQQRCNSLDDCGDGSDEDNCSPEISCGFDDVFKCGYTVSHDNFPYIWHQSKAQLGDAVRPINLRGMYMYAASGTQRSGVTARLISKVATIKTNSCLEVIYMQDSDTSKNFKIYILRDTRILNILDTINYQGRLWLKRKYNLQPGMYQLVFEAELNGDKTIIDQISLRDGKCQQADINQYTCYHVPSGLDYDQDLSNTTNGPCQRWDLPETETAVKADKWYEVDWEHFRTLFPEGNLTLAGSKCRNPERDVQPYCYVNNKRTLCKIGTHFDTTCPDPDDCEFQCNNGRCITTDKKCNGINDCGDASDETGQVCDQTCRRTGKGEFYTGTNLFTRNGVNCLEWKNTLPQDMDAHFPDKSFEDAKSYCRNPNGAEGGPWCFVATDKMEFCNIPMCPGYNECSEYQFKCKDGTCISDTQACDGKDDCAEGEDEITPCKISRYEAARKDCRVTLKGIEYQGVVNVTKSGKNCMQWSAQNDEEDAPDHNYCRNRKITAGTYGEVPWCFNTDGKEEDCDIPRCECSMYRFDLPYIGSQNVTRSGLECIPWIDTARSLQNLSETAATSGVAAAENFCREAEQKVPFCNTALPTFARDTCHVKVCPGAPEPRGISCKFDSPYMCGYKTIKGSNYKNKYLSNADTVRWVFRSMPSNLTDTDKKTEKKDRCIRKETRGADYKGTQTKTKSGIPCQRWDSQFPHTFGSYIDEDFPEGEDRVTAKNFCRNPKSELSNVWCYTTDPTVRWEPCDVPECASSAMMAVTGFLLDAYADLVSPTMEFHSDEGYCLKFKVLLPQVDDPPTLQILIQDENASKRLIWTQYPENSWIEKSLDLNYTGNYNIIFRIRYGDDDSNSVLDDVVLEPGKCPRETCGEDQFQCANGNCIARENKLCDGIDDCLDNSDEATEDCICQGFKCGDGRCISHLLVLDGIENCLDSSDEKQVEYRAQVSKPAENPVNKHALKEDYIRFPDVHLSGQETYGFFETAAHQKKDFIHGCNWNNERCNMSGVDVTVTDLGFCYTFNKHDTFVISNRGSNYGLKLVLNVETYEYMESTKSTTGVKVHLHKPSSLPPVSELGFALGPGFGYLVEVDVTDTTKLSHPWGNCEPEWPLRFFKGDQYDRPNCLLECSTNLTISSCSCFAFHMPVNETVDGVPLCDFQQYLNCYSRLGYNKTGSQDCGCPEQCNEMTYSRKISFGTLGSQANDNILSDDSSYLMGRVTEAAAANALKDAESYVTDRDIFDRISELLQSILSVVDGLWDVTKDRVGADRTIYKIDEAVRLAIKKYESDYNSTFVTSSVSKPGLKSEMEGLLYESAENYTLVDSMIYTVQKWQSRMEVLFGADFSGSGLTNQTKLDVQNQMIEEFEITISIYNGLSDNAYPKMKDCFKSLTLKDIRKKFDQGEFDQVTNRIKSIKEHIQNTKKCMESEREIVKSKLAKLLSLNPAENIIKAEKDNRESRKALHIREMRVPIVHIKNSYTKVLDEFMRGKVTKGDVVDKISSNLLPQMIVNTKRILFEINSLFRNPYTAYISRTFEDIKTNYMELVQLLGELNPNFPKASIVNKRRGMEIWKRPLIQLEPSVTFRQKRKVPDALINGYFSGTNVDLDYIIDEHVTAYAEPILGSLSAYLYNIIVIELTLENITHSISSLAEKTQKATRLDEDFVKKNFLTVDFFLAQLSRRVVVDNEALPLPDVFGNIGGYMGLLIGGSILSVCEILDLIATFILGRFWVKKSPSDGKVSEDADNPPANINGASNVNDGFEPDLKNGTDKMMITTMK